MNERDDFDEIAIRTEADTTPSTALSASDQQADRRLLARDIGFALSQNAATKRCVTCACEPVTAEQRSLCEEDRCLHGIGGRPADFGCTLWQARTPDRED